MRSPSHSHLLARVFANDDMACAVVTLLGAVGATALRAVSRLGLRAITHTVWARECWHLWTELACGSSLGRRKLGQCAFAHFRAVGASKYMCACREKRLSAALQDRGLYLRRDSWLCESFIAGQAQVGSLEAVVNGMHEMSFFFGSTAYAQCQEHIADNCWEEACHMAADAGRGRPEDFYVPLEREALSAAAKQQALRQLISAQGLKKVLLIAPPFLHRRVRSLGSGIDVENTEELRYATKSDTAKQRQRDLAHRRVQERRDEDNKILGAQRLELLRLTSLSMGSEHHFPASLSSRVRAVLHGEAEDLGLMHESRGRGRKRHLVAWRAHSDVSDSESLLSDGGDEGA